MMKVGITAMATTMLLLTSVVARAESLKVGFLTTLSGSTIDTRRFPIQ